MKTYSVNKAYIYGGISCDVCPFQTIGDCTCMASFSSMSCDPKRKETYCTTENYTNCPMFLSKLLSKE